MELLSGLLSRFGVMDLAAPYDLLEQIWVLVGIGVLGALDFIGDKVPGVDHALHVVGGVVNAAAGAVLFAAQAGIADVPPALSLALGVLVAGGVHLTRATVRPVATATTGGLANPLLSTAEDSMSLGLTLLAVFAPPLAALGLAGVLLLTYRLWARVRERKTV